MPPFCGFPGGDKYNVRKDAGAKKAQQKYMERFAVARVRMDREHDEEVQSHAAAHGESVNGLIGRAISETMERDNQEGGGLE